MGKNAQIGGILSFFKVLNWIPIGAAGDNPSVNRPGVQNPFPRSRMFERGSADASITPHLDTEIRSARQSL